MKLTSLIYAALILALANAPVLSQENTQWIVIGDDAAATFAASLASVGLGSSFSVLETTDGRTVAAFDPAVESSLLEVIHTTYHRCGGYTVHPTREAALAEANNPFYAPNYVADPNLFPRSIDQQAVVLPSLNRVDKARIVATIRKLQNLGTWYYQHEKGQTAAIELKRQWESYGTGRSNFAVALNTHGWRQNSVIATIRGAELPDEIVVIGGHLDSINTRNENAAPGADDDASGVAAVSEVLRVLLARDFHPKRTLKFIAYAAEEVGLRGSREIAGTYLNADKKVIAALQMDMTGYAGSKKNMYFITDYVSADLTDFLKNLIRAYNGPGPHHISYGETACGYGCSDHVAWTGVGVPAAFPFESAFSDYNRQIHSANDTASNLDATGTHEARFAKLGIEFMMELGKNATAAPSTAVKRYIYTSLRMITSSASRGCGFSDWTCMTQLCKRDLGNSAWRGWAGCWRDGSNFLCNFECGAVRRRQ